MESSNLTSASEEGSSFWEGEVKIIHLPSEILDKVLQNLSYHEISKAREVCRPFRDVGNGILNRGFCKLNDYVEQVLAETNDELKATVLQRRQEGDNSEKAVPKEQMRRLRMLDVINVQLRLVRAMCYRFIFLSDISCSFFAGKVIDVTHGILKLVRLKTIENVDAKEVGELLKLIDKFTDFFHNIIEPTLVASEAVSNRATLFGSKVIDLLDCFLDCYKNVDVRLDSEGWCHLKGEYKIFLTMAPRIEYSSIHFIGDLEQLSIKGQTSLHEWLRYLIKRWSQFHVLDEEHVLMDESPEASFSFYSGSYEELSKGFFRSYFKGSFSSRYYRRRYLEGNDITTSKGDARSIVDNNGIIEERKEEALTFKLDMRCRKELAPLEKLLEWRKNSSDEEHSEVEGSSENTDHDLDMRLEILSPLSESGIDRVRPSYKCLIKQKYLQEEPLPNPAKAELVLAIPISENHYEVICSFRMKWIGTTLDEPV